MDTQVREMSEFDRQGVQYYKAWHSLAEVLFINDLAEGIMITIIGI